MPAFARERVKSLVAARATRTSARRDKALRLRSATTIFISGAERNGSVLNLPTAGNLSIVGIPADRSHLFKQPCIHMSVGVGAVSRPNNAITEINFALLNGIFGFMRKAFACSAEKLDTVARGPVGTWIRKRFILIAPLASRHLDSIATSMFQIPHEQLKSCTFKAARTLDR